MNAVATVASAHVGAYSSDLPLLLELDDDEEEKEVDSLAPMVSLSLSPSLPMCAGHYGSSSHSPDYYIDMINRPAILYTIFNLGS